MQELLDNIYGDTLRKIIEDLLVQYKDDTRPEMREKFIRLLELPIETYNTHYHGTFELPKLD